MVTNPAVVILRAACFLIFLLTSTLHARAQTRVVAVGDAHGAYPELVAILQRVGLIDGNRQWLGASIVLVQAGDVIDRGRDSRQCLDFLMDLERQAPKQNGRVIPLLGDHEVWMGHRLLHRPGTTGPGVGGGWDKQPSVR